MGELLPLSVLLPAVVVIGLLCIAFIVWLVRLPPEQLTTMAQKGVLGLVLAFGAVLLGILLQRRRKSPVVERAKQKEAEAVVQAESERDGAVKAAGEKLAADKAKPSVSRANDIIKRRAGLLCLAAVFLASPARAEEEPCTEVGDKVVCTRVGFDVLLDSYAELEHRAAVAEADAKAEGKKLEAAHERVVALQAEIAKPTPLSWLPFAAVGAAFLVGMVVGVLVAE